MDQAGKIDHCIICKDVHGYMQVLTAVSSKLQQEATNFRVLVKLSVGFVRMSLSCGDKVLIHLQICRSFSNSNNTSSLQCFSLFLSFFHFILFFTLIQKLTMM